MISTAKTGTEPMILSQTSSSSSPHAATGHGDPILLEIQDLTKTYRKGIRANDGISLSVPAGAVYGLLGHNGSGKTTLINQVIGLLKPSAGSITIDGHDVVADPAYARAICSVQAQSQMSLDGLKPRQAIELIGRLRGGSVSDVRARTDRLIEALDIERWQDTDAGRLSGGVKRLTAFAMASVVPGRLVMLDEPTNDVDPIRRRLLWDQVRVLAAEGAAVLLVTHNVLEAERSVDRLLILDEGRPVVEGTPSELKSRVSNHLRLEIHLNPGSPAPHMPEFVTDHTVTGSVVLAHLPPQHATSALTWLDELNERRIIDEFALTPSTLEDVFIELVGKPTEHPSRKEADDGDIA